MRDKRIQEFSPSFSSFVNECNVVRRYENHGQPADMGRKTGNLLTIYHKFLFPVFTQDAGGGHAPAVRLPDTIDPETLKTKANRTGIRLTEITAGETQIMKGI